MTPDFSAAITSGEHWLMVLITVGVACTTVGVHFEALASLNRWLPHLKRSARLRVLLLILAVLVVHTAEIWLFGGAVWAISHFPELGSIKGAEHGLKLLDAVYLSTTTYTTLGYGDLVPAGPLRLLLGIEALTGLVLITWSASFTYLEMQRDWLRELRPR
jgi:hypothetical protein